MRSIATGSLSPAAVLAFPAGPIADGRMLRIRRGMPNHMHLILTPRDASGLALALARAHRLYAGYVNARARQTGHLFQGRSCGYGDYGDRDYGDSAFNYSWGN
jgi:hypothetical protein